MSFTYIFVAHSSADQQVAHRMLAFLESRGIGCWIAPRDIPLGQQWAEAILDAIEQASAMLLVFSSSSNESPQVLREVERAVNRRVPIYPVKIEDVPPCRAMEYYLSSHQWKDVFDGDLEEKLSQLLPTIIEHLEISTPEARHVLEEALRRGQVIEKRQPLEPGVAPAGAGEQRSGLRRRWWLVIPAAGTLAVAAVLLYGIGGGDRGGSATNGSSDTSVAAVADTLPEPTSIAGDLSAGPVAGMTFSYIPAGGFVMGSPDSEQGRDTDEQPLRNVRIDRSFQIMTTEVRQETWEAVMGTDPAFHASEGCPVENVSWEQCQAFVDSLSRLDPDHRYRLPSEAEWEYACRAGTDAPFYWGSDTTEAIVSEYCWYEANSGGQTHAVGLKTPNDWGLYDMSGNVLEWCEDRYHPDLTQVPGDGTAFVPTGPDSARVVRGGSSRNSPAGSRSASRSAYDQDRGSPGIGFRVVREESG